MDFRESILQIRQNIIKEFKKIERIVLPVLRFIVMFLGIYTLREITNYTGGLGSYPNIAILALIGTFISVEWILIEGIVLLTCFIFSSNPILAGIVFLFMMFIYFAFMRLFPKESLLCIIMLAAFLMNVPLIVPIVAALVGNYVSVIAMILGIIIWFLIPEVISIVQPNIINKLGIMEWIDNLEKLDIGVVLLDRTMLTMVVVTFIVFSVVYIIRIQAIDYAPYIAIGVGMVVNVLGFGMGILFLQDIGIKLGQVVIWTIVSGLLALVVQFFLRTLDYQCSEMVQFEDEDNYYYVKVVPKINITSTHSTVKHSYTDDVNIKLESSLQMKSYDNQKGI